jgi:hypothetical protein
MARRVLVLRVCTSSTSSGYGKTRGFVEAVATDIMRVR